MPRIATTVTLLLLLYVGRRLPDSGAPSGRCTTAPVGHTRSMDDTHPGRFSFQEYYVDYPIVEDALAAFVNNSLSPRGPTLCTTCSPLWISRAVLFATDMLSEDEAAFLWSASDVVERNANRVDFEKSIAASGLRIIESIDLASETVEWAEEQTGKAARELMAIARLRRDPRRYIDQFGQAAYESKRADAYWHVYRMLGKLTSRIDVLVLGT